MHGPVLCETDFVAEGFIAQLAGEWPFAIVRPPRMYLSMQTYHVFIDVSVDVKSL